MSEEENTGGNIIYSVETVEFVKSANDYCQWIEEKEVPSGRIFIQQGVRLLSAVYAGIIKVPETEPALEGGNEKFVTEKDWSEIYQRIVDVLGGYNAYLRIAEEEEFDRSELVSHTISEDLADIYQDLKDFTMQYRQGIEEIMNDAVWEVYSNFEQYWGAKALNALRALHQLYVNKVDPEQEGGNDFEPDLPDEPPAYDTSFFKRIQDLNEEDV